MALACLSGSGTGSDGRPGVLKVSIIFSSISNGARVQARGFKNGLLSAQSPGSATLQSGTVFFDMQNLSGGSTTTSSANQIPGGDYYIYLKIDKDNDGTYEVTEPGSLQEVYVDGDTTLNLSSVDFQAMIAEEVTVSSFLAPPGAKAQCFWLAPGGTVESSSSVLGTSKTESNSFSGGRVRTDNNTALVSAIYDLFCRVDSNGNNISDLGDFTGYSTSVRVTGFGTSINASSAVNF